MPDAVQLREMAARMLALAIGKPVSTFPDHESRCKIAESAERADREPHPFSAISLKWNGAA
jgi:hypothetical protein